MPGAIKIRITHESLSNMGCDTLNNVVGLLRYACDVRGSQQACNELRSVEAIARSKGCTI